ncbi:MAG: CHAT domain-containing protein [Algicola sp.]|nr:CHAT domain-containing protein [Algicola sp.]
MNPIKTISFEILRKGPSHNQLLSPLTDYLCLCGNYGATSVQVPWEHAKFMNRLTELRYPDSDTESHAAKIRRQSSINELSRAVAEIFASSVGLQQSLHSQPCVQASGRSPLTHLRLIVSASELALLPYELSKTINDLEGRASEDWLSIQSLDPICITRQIRNVHSRSIKWPTKPKILLIAASPTGVIPINQHIQAMLAAIKPWITYDDSESLKDFDNQKEAEVLKAACDKYLTILTEANIHSIADACRKNSYSHIHILAHGQEIKDSEGTPFGIALHDINHLGKADVVSGSRFATAICPRTDHQPPAVVTVASCDSGYVSSPVHSGASFAHDIHKTGIPLVVASQFPLTFAGSTALVEHVYGQMLWGEHPLEVLYDLRCELYSHQSHKNHDWASLVVYENLPEDIVEQLKQTKYKQTRSAIDIILAEIDEQIKVLSCIDEKETDDPADDDPADDEAADDEAANEETANEETADDTRKREPSLKKLDIARLEEKIKNDYIEVESLFKRYPDDNGYQAEVLGLKGSAYKRMAEMYFKLHLEAEAVASAEVKLEAEAEAETTKADPESDENKPEQFLKKSRNVLTDATQYYRQATENQLFTNSNQATEATLHWLITQYIALQIFCGEKYNQVYWDIAVMAAEADIKRNKGEIWAHGSLFELYLLKILVNDGVVSTAKNDQVNSVIAKQITDSRNKARSHLRALVKQATQNMKYFAIESTRRQVRRYLDWWLHPDFELTKRPNLNRPQTLKFIRSLLRILK